jgi:aspartate ammonia-lyase
MPGKVNPVIPEVVNQVCFRVIGNDVTISFAAEAGQLQLNVMEPVIAYSLFESLRIMTNACTLLREKCVVGIEANSDRTRDMVLQTIGIVTALTPTLGYKTCASVAREAYERGASVVDVVLERGLLSREQLDAMFSPEAILDLTKNC